MNISVDNFSINIDSNIKLDTSTQYNTGIFRAELSNSNRKLSKNNFSQISLINSFLNLRKNWDSYGAKEVNSGAVTKAKNFIVDELNDRSIEVFFTAPTVDGDVLIELKSYNNSIEIIFSGEVQDQIICSSNNETHAEEVLNETTLNAYLKWLVS